MTKLPSGGYPALYSYENYLAQQLPVLWMPQFDSADLRGERQAPGRVPAGPGRQHLPGELVLRQVAHDEVATRPRSTVARPDRVSAPCARHPARVDPDAGRLPAGRTDLAPRATPSTSRCRRSSSTSRTGRTTASCCGTPRSTTTSPGTATPRSAWTSAARGDSDGILEDEYLPLEQRGRGGGHPLARLPPVVQRQGRHHRQVLGRLQRAADRRAPPARARRR